MRNYLAAGAGVLVLALVNGGIYQRERLLTAGQVVLLELAPVDPRSLMQGDYMALRFQITNEVTKTNEKSADGFIVVRLTDQRVGSFVRRNEGQALAPGEVRVRYRMRDGNVKLATNAFFFQEGTGPQYAQARYGEFRVAPDGTALLTHLVDKDLHRLGAPAP